MPKYKLYNTFVANAKEYLRFLIICVFVCSLFLISSRIDLIFSTEIPSGFDPDLEIISTFSCMCLISSS